VTRTVADAVAMSLGSNELRNPGHGPGPPAPAGAGLLVVPATLPPTVTVGGSRPPLGQPAIMTPDNIGVTVMSVIMMSELL
jgi:hypothetical protein